MIIGLCGFGCSGASAVIDYLRSFKDIDFFCEYEFQLLHEADGIQDLKYHLTKSGERIVCNVALNRFIKKQKYGTFGKQLNKLLDGKYELLWKTYVEELTLATWEGVPSVYDPIDISGFAKNDYIYFAQKTIKWLLRKISDNLNIDVKQIKYFSILSEDKFDEITKRFLSDLLKELKININKDVVIDMLYSVTNPNDGMEYFDNTKAIIVNRDPRDVYVTAKIHPDYSRFMPNQDVNSFIAYYRTLQERIMKNYKNVLMIQYEDLIYKYTETTECICNFLNIKNKPDKEFCYFDPLYSVRYTNRIDLYSKYIDDIAAIELNLNEFIYDFSNALPPFKNDKLVKLKGNNKYIGGVVEPN